MRCAKIFLDKSTTCVLWKTHQMAHLDVERPTSITQRSRWSRQCPCHLVSDLLMSLEDRPCRRQAGKTLSVPLFQHTYKCHLVGTDQLAVATAPTLLLRTDPTIRHPPRYLRHRSRRTHYRKPPLHPAVCCAATPRPTSAYMDGRANSHPSTTRLALHMHQARTHPPGHPRHAPPPTQPISTSGTP